MPGLHASGTAGLLASAELDRDIAGVQGTWGWSTQSGAVTFSASYTFNVAAVAAGDYTVNSVSGAAYAGGTVVLDAADATNPRIDVVVITAAGAVSVVKGTPRGASLVYAAPTSGASPTTAVATSGPVPGALTTSQLEIARIYVPANNTPAMSATSITDRRVPMPAASAVALVGSSSAATSTTSTSAVDLVTISGLSILVTQPWRLEFNWAKTLAFSADTVGYGLKVNSTVTNEAGTGANTALCNSSATQQVEDGICIVSTSPRDATHLTGQVVTKLGHVSATGAAAADAAGANTGMTAPYPNATITSIAIRARNANFSNGAQVTSIRILTGID